jgi:phosphomevalonate kinase
MQQHTIEFEGDEVKAEECLIFKMKADHGAVSGSCAFCNVKYSDSLKGRWDLFQSWAVGFHEKNMEESALDDCVSFFVCSDCRQGKAVDFIVENLSDRKILLQNASNDKLYHVDSFSNLNY